ncbi:hypothetical protein HZH66_015355 [Vespula vulgaris]|uniref:Uncharacterized protein n=1 Tax=Vespula vulgaris TaxID=7454 RepID=A0A834IW36_VESVU|nr:hypothetical protein HZH66_015355 [Vespula vulgaris]
MWVIELKGTSSETSSLDRSFEFTERWKKCLGPSIRCFAEECTARAYAHTNGAYAAYISIAFARHGLFHRWLVGTRPSEVDGIAAEAERGPSP